MRDDRIVFQLPATANLRERIRDLYGVELLQRLLEVNGAACSKNSNQRFHRSGRSEPAEPRPATRVRQRPRDRKQCDTGAFREGYHTALMKGQYPVTFLFLSSIPAWWM